MSIKRKLQEMLRELEEHDSEKDGRYDTDEKVEKALDEEYRQSSMMLELTQETFKEIGAKVIKDKNTLKLLELIEEQAEATKGKYKDFSGDVMVKAFLLKLFIMQSMIYALAMAHGAGMKRGEVLDQLTSIGARR